MEPWRIVVGIDFSKASRVALEAAGRLAQDLGASVVLVHVYAPPTVAPGISGSIAIAGGERAAPHQPDLEMAEALELSTRWAAPLRGDGLDVEAEAHEGDPVQVLLEAADAHEAGLIVVGSHGRTGLARLVLGSVAQGVVRRSRRPVLVVPQRMARTKD